MADFKFRVVYPSQVAMHSSSGLHIVHCSLAMEDHINFIDNDAGNTYLASYYQKSTYHFGVYAVPILHLR